MQQNIDDWAKQSKVINKTDIKFTIFCNLSGKLTSKLVLHHSRNHYQHILGKSNSRIDYSFLV